MSALLLLRAVAAARLLAVADALGVEGPADDLVADSGQVPHPAAAHQHDRVLLQVVPDARDVGGDLDLAGEPDPRHLAQGGVRLLGRGRVDARANAPALGAALEGRGSGLGYLVLAALADQLLDGGHRVSVFFRASFTPVTCWFLYLSDPRGRACRRHHGTPAPAKAGCQKGGRPTRVLPAASGLPAGEPPPVNARAPACRARGVRIPKAPASGKANCEMDVIANAQVPLAIPGSLGGGRPRAPAGTLEGTGPRAGPLANRGRRLLVVGAEVVVLEADRIAAGGLPERVVRYLLVGGRGRVDGGPRVLGRLHPDAAVPEHSGAGRDQLADDHVLLQAQQRVRLGVDGGVGEHPGRLLERGRGQPGLGGEGGPLLHPRPVHLLAPRPRHAFAAAQFCVTGPPPLHPLADLAEDDLEAR